METNTQLELANNIIKYTGTNLFLTGKAGTGKTTFLHTLRENSPKRMVVVAPTGVAAINAKGVTIHSFFQLSFAPFVPGTKPSSEFFRFSKEKINILRSLDLLVIDEISMVRADLMDAVDYVLRHFRHKEQPFGGVQLLMIGDLEQLAPVVKDDEWSLLDEHYPSPFFFDSRALKETPYLCVELKTVYRQSDMRFINMLNRVRENSIDSTLLQELNKRYKPDFKPGNEEGYITLTTHNRQAQLMNSKKMAGIREKSYTYEAKIKGDFPDYSFPTDEKLELKKGAQVMFVKNDLSPDKRYYNGKIAVITRLDERLVVVQGKEDEQPIVVEKALWSNMKYTINPDTKELQEEEEGSFEQYPLKTAWAITVHKSQGMTFDKAIIDAGASFTHGQVYVALSRCRTLEGLVLHSPLSANAIIRSENIDDFARYTEENEPDEQQFQNLRREYFAKLLFEQFDYLLIQSCFKAMRRLLNDHFLSLYPELVKQYRQAENVLQDEILNVAERFQSQLQQLLSKTENPETDGFLQERIKKAAAYFFEKTKLILQDLSEKTIIETDNKEVKKRVNDVWGQFQTEIRQKQKTLEACLEGFTVPAYLSAKSKATIEEEPSKPKKKERTSKDSPDKVVIPKDILHPELYEWLRSWRYELAQQQNVPAYVILSQMALLGITNLLPQDSAQLLKIPGVGKATLTRYGEDILRMVQESIGKYNYVFEKQETVNTKAYSVEKIRETYKQAYLPWLPEDDSRLKQLLCEGKTVNELEQIFERNRGAIISRIKKI